MKMYCKDFIVNLKCNVKEKKVIIYNQRNEEECKEFNLLHLSVNNLVYCLNEFLLENKLIEKNDLELNETDEKIVKNFEISIANVLDMIILKNFKYPSKDWTLNSDAKEIEIIETIYEILSRNLTIIPIETQI